uniref:DOMON domain-containing protein n=1 Tax=Ditylenchus dipsaci TaxID=166011 RepID=A0A915DVY7_9BILA
MTRNDNFLCLFIILSVNILALGQSVQFYEQAKSCSFMDETTGYSLIWHTNCTGYVNFVLNSRNFPTTQGNFWIGVSFDLLSQELVLIEVNNGFVTVQPARIYGNEPPQKNLMSPFLASPRGNFFGASLEATFSIHQSLLTGCKQWIFYTSPSGNNCMLQNQVTNQYGQYGGAGTPNYFRPEIPLIGNTAIYNGQQPQRYYNINNDLSSSYNYDPQISNSQQQRGAIYPQAYQVGMAAPQLSHNGQAGQYGSNSPQYPTNQYGQYMNGGQNGSRYSSVSLPQYGNNQYMSSQYSQYGGGAQFGASPATSPYAALQRSPNNYNQQQGSEYSNNYNYRAMQQQPQQQVASVPPGMSLSQIFAQLDDMPHTIYGTNRPYPAKMEKDKKSRRKRQSVNINNDYKQPGQQLQGTAYEGQDKHFVRSTPYFDSPYTPYYLPAANKLIYDQVSPHPYGYPSFGAPNTDNPSTWRFFDPGANSTPMYYPYRTATAGDVAQQPYKMQETDQRAINFDDVVKCDGGVDPYWCANYVSQFVHWQKSTSLSRPRVRALP